MLIVTELLGYADRRSARPGDSVTVMVSSDAPEVHAEMIRLVDGSPEPDDMPAPSERLRPPLMARAAGVIQRAVPGSRADLPLPPGWANDRPWSLRTWFYATTPGGVEPQGPEAVASSRMTGQLLYSEWRRQIVLALGRASGDLSDVPALAVVIAPDGRLSLELDGDTVAWSTGRILGRAWYGLLVSVDDTAVDVYLSSRVGLRYTADQEEHLHVDHDGAWPSDVDVLRLATWRVDTPDECFNGKIASATVASARPTGDPYPLLREQAPLPGSVIASWDPSVDPGTDCVLDVGPQHLVGRTINLPTRAVTGPFWQPGSGAMQLTPQHDAIHFHADDIGDLDWQPTMEIPLPPAMKSGVYAIRLRAGDREMHIPVYVRPSKPSARVAFLVPTNTYLAYANHRMFLGNSELNHYIASHPVEPNEYDKLVLDYPFLGRSIYDRHDDGSGVCLASWRRPLVSLEPTARDFLAAGPKHFSADLYVVGWLERSGIPYEVLTDEDLDSEGLGALQPYDVVVTGSHPEYWTTRMMDALQRYLRSAGKLMYLGGNGFYWMTTLSSDRTTIEVRRGHQGSRAWDSEPGETLHATTGELGGLWRNLGICPQSVVGVGMAAQGWGGGRGYRRLPDSFDPRVASFFEGIDDDELIGDFGFVMCGAVGDEVDRMDHALGTPTHALHLATSETLPDQYQLTVEEVRNMTPAFGGTQCDAVRSDMVWFDLPGGGEVFSVGSVSWAAALGWQMGQNNVHRLSTNVLRSMLARR